MTKVFLLCSGLGRINRGYESFTQECFDALSDAPELDITLFKGGGPADHKQRVLWNLRRGGRFNDWLGRKIGKSSYWLEQITFTLSLLPYVARQKPDVIYFSDCNIGNLLWHWRRLTRQNYKLLLSNGGPLSPPFPRWDLVQQVAPLHLETALAAGQHPTKQSLLPYGIRMEPEIHALSVPERTALRQSLGLPEDRPVVLSVGIVNQSHKRMDYVVREVAALPTPRPYLVMLGQQDSETPQVRALAETMLGPEGYQIHTVPYAEVSRYYQAADAFVLASRLEGFGRVYLEAMSWGLPCLAHDSALTRYVLGSIGVLGDFEKPGSLATCLCEVLQNGYDLPARLQRHHAAFERFSWQRLRPQYVQMLTRCAAGQTPSGLLQP